MCIRIISNLRHLTNFIAPNSSCCEKSWNKKRRENSHRKTWMISHDHQNKQRYDEKLNFYRYVLGPNRALKLNIYVSQWTWLWPSNWFLTKKINNCVKHSPAENISRKCLRKWDSSICCRTYNARLMECLWCYFHWSVSTKPASNRWRLSKAKVFWQPWKISSWKSAENDQRFP